MLFRALLRGANVTARRRLLASPRPALYTRTCIRHNSTATESPAYRVLNNNLPAFEAMGKLMLAAHERGWDISPGTKWPIDQTKLKGDSELEGMLFTFAHSFNSESDLHTVLREFYGEQGMAEILLNICAGLELRALGLEGVPWLTDKSSSSEESQKKSRSEQEPPQEVYKTSMSITELLVQSFILSLAVFIMGADERKKGKTDNDNEKDPGPPKPVANESIDDTYDGSMSKE